MDVFEVEEILLLVELVVTLDEEDDLVEVESFEVLLDFVEVEETLTLDVVDVDFFELVLDDVEEMTTEDTVAVEPV